MTDLLRALIVVVLGIVLGLAITAVSVTSGTSFGAAHSGPWVAFPRSGSPEIDPYARAIAARTGEVPLGNGEGITFVAAKDSSGAALSASCSYVVAGQTPQARFWTLTLFTPQGALVANPANRTGFTSSEILRAQDGSFEIAVSPNARPGNWLPTGDAARFVLVLNLLDTNVSATPASLEALPMPAIKREACS